jgi:two-component system response regulator (stage 0 sporulation protein A)
MSRPITVLICDWDRNFRLLLSNAIELSPHFTLLGSTSSPESLIEMAKSLSPDLILMDVIYPGIDGLAVVDLLRNSIKQPPTIIVISSFTTGMIQARYLSHGVSYTIAKPCRFQDVLSWARYLLDHNESAPDTETSKYNMQCLFNIVDELLQELRYPPHLRGYACVRSALMLVQQDSDRLFAITKLLYPDVAKELQITPNAVERNIRHGIDRTWKTGNRDSLLRYFGTVAKPPTNSEFLATLSSEINRQQSSAYK